MSIVYQCDRCGGTIRPSELVDTYSWALYPATEGRYRSPKQQYEDLRFCRTECLVAYVQELNASGVQPEDCLKSEA